MSVEHAAPGTAAESMPSAHAAKLVGAPSETRRAALLHVRAQIDEMLDAESVPASSSRRPKGLQWMRICEFARSHRYSTKTVSQWCKLGMPHIGSGHYTRINVREAEAWIADDGPTKAARMRGMIAHATEGK